MNLQLADKRALVTGSTAGIGFAIAQALAQEGASVIVNGRTGKRVDEALHKIRKELRDARVTGVACDLGTLEGVKTGLNMAPQADILVNNLGQYWPKPFEQISDDDWMKIIETNFMSGVRLSRHYLPQMKEKNWGRIIFISSESGVQIPAEMIHYGMTKTAQIAVARGLAETTKGTNVTVNSILPGPTASEGVGDFVKSMAAAQKTDAATVEREFFKHVRPSSLIQRFARPEEVAALVAFVVSPLSSATNGAALRADGGVVRSIL
jgi:NAD(P)-dependent dehydrogenase (short-subunit alcohol dehydrogenase family)